MAELVLDCPRCRAAKTTFDFRSATRVTRDGVLWEAFCVCRACLRSTVFRLRSPNPVAAINGAELVKSTGNVGDKVRVDGHIGIADFGVDDPPEHLPAGVLAAFTEASRCGAIKCYNAAAAMYRLGIDLATAPMLPMEGEPNPRTRRDLALRLAWLFDNGKLPDGLKDLAAAVREDGNDGAHRGTITAIEAADLEDFARALFERIFTEPRRLELAKERRDARRNN